MDEELIKVNRIRIFCVNTAEDQFSDKLGIVASVLDSDAIGKNEAYSGEGPYLVVIHPDDAGALNKEWEGLDEQTRKRVLWLAVSGSGFPARVSKTSRVHFLRYPYQDDTLKQRDEIKRCFDSFIKSLKEKAGAFEDPDWRLLYPPENFALIMLFTLLSASQVIDVEADLKHWLQQPDVLDDFYAEYVNLKGAWNLECHLSKPDLVKMAECGPVCAEAKMLLEELRQCLGAVPD